MRSRKLGGVSPGVIINAAVSVVLAVLGIFAFAAYNWRWALWLAFAAIAYLVGVCIWWLWRQLRDPYGRSIFRPTTNAYFIEGPTSRIVSSMGALLALALYGAFGIVSGRIFLPMPDSIETFRGLAAAMVGIAFIIVACGSMVRFHTRYRRAELVFGASILVFFFIFISATMVHEGG